MQKRPIWKVVETKIYADFTKRKKTADRFGSGVLDPQKAHKEFNETDRRKKRKSAIYNDIECVDPIELFFNDTATTEIYTLSLHDALPI